ncbi:MAG: thermonuclease family protein [Bacillales bacterium]|nr:thermonuclease family protein [Bacillales bacterium]
MKKWFAIFSMCMLILSGCSSSGGQQNKHQSTTKTTESAAKESTEKASDHQSKEAYAGTKDTDIKGLRAVVLRVVDGDTFVARLENGKEERVRMILVDTPETKHPRLGVQPFGPEASAFTKSKLTGKTVTLEFDVQERDKYGRLLAYVWLNHQNYNKLLIEKGLARVAVFPPNTKYVDEFRAAQAVAQKEKKGIWSIENYVTDHGYNSDGKEHSSRGSRTDIEKSSTLDHSKGNCHIKGNISSSGKKIYHMPGDEYYDETKPEKMFCSREEAEAAGFRPSQR